MPIVIGIIMLVLMTTCATKYFAPPQTAQQVAAAKLHEEGDDAKGIAKQFAREKLASPSSAVFPPLSEFTATRNKEGNWEVSGYVDTRSGASIERQRIVCTLKKNGYSWTPLSLKVGP